MKINKENLGKIIKTLQSKYNEMNDNDNLDFNSFPLLNKDDLFVEPENSYLEKTQDNYELDIIYKYFHSKESVYVRDWSRSFHPIKTKFYREKTGSIHYHANSDEDLVKTSFKCKLISFENFEKYIVNKDES